ncbi:hypothetical protein PN36_22970 [Candidatus Thiomargarita nelsonii]|uniref:VWFA domain-containing protein n=1 Tax=Candidatus Thiomargarita nelsonii TaxID=1003181 RepID=A0A4E0R1A2_9GAMM|nr:hypothetical protein PN36_22970 [Candidatus Thiomargarita nelsonii]
MLIYQSQIVRATCFLIVVFLGISGITSLAAFPQIPGSGECPPEDTYIDDEEQMRLLLNSNRQIILPRVSLYTNPDFSNTIRNHELKFLQHVVVLKENVGLSRAKLVRATGKRCGWIPENAVLATNSPLKVKEIKNVQGFDDEKNTLNAKILVRNKAGENVASDVPLYDAVGGKEIGRLKIFSIFNIYTYETKNDEVYFFIGGQKLVEDMPEAVLLGWVKAKDVISWSSRMNLYYAPDKTKVPIYENEKDAKAQVKPLATQGKAHIEPKKHNIPRFPVLDHRVVSKNATVYTIAFAGEACISSEDCISGRDLSGRRGAVGGKLMETENIDVLFVIDATKSVQKYFKPVVSAVESFATSISGDARKIRFSVAVYGDYKTSQGDPNNIQFSWPVPFSDTNNTTAMRRLKRVPIFDDPRHDYPEAAFAALTKAINEADWRESAGLRLVIWIGDHPNRSAYKVSTQDVADALKEKNAIWSAINVKGKYRRSLNQKFLSQAKNIAAKVENWSYPIVKTYKSSDSKDSSNTESEVRARLDEVYETSKQIAQKIYEISIGHKTTSSARASRLPSAVLADRYIKERLGISEQQLRDTYSRNQLIVKGVVYQKESNPDFNFWISMRSTDLFELQTQTASFCEVLKYTGGDIYNDLRDSMVKTLKMITGDTLDRTQTIRKFLSKRLHVPKKHFSELLDKSVNDFIRWYINPDNHKEARKFKSQICLKAAMLDQVKHGKRVDREDMEFDQRSARWVPKKGAGENFNWLWGAENGIRYFYIPLEYIP